ncbi:MAG: hypothetical protein AAGK00_15390 [Pseudomonadota bacterium]
MTDVFLFDLDGDDKPDLGVVMGPESKMGEVGGFVDFYIPAEGGKMAKVDGAAITFPDYIDYIETGGKEMITFPDYIDYIGKGEDGPQGAWLSAVRPAITWDYNGESGKEGAETWANEADALIFLIG